MTIDELADLLTLRGYQVKKRGQEVILQQCIRCGNDRWNMELNASKGVWSSWCCRNGGRLDALLHELTGVSVRLPVNYQPRKTAPVVPQQSFTHVSVSQVPSAMQYLQNVRHLPPNVITQYEFTVCMDQGHPLYGRILTPMRSYWTSEIFGYIGRGYTPGKRPKYLSTATQLQVAGYRVRGNAACVIVEGFFDGIAVHRAGFNTAILSGTASPQLVEFAARIPEDCPLFILLDGEAVEEAHTLQWIITAVRPATVIVLPSGMDPDQFQPRVLTQLIAKAAKIG